MKSAAPKVSIVIPVYNGSNFLGQAIESALAQTYSNVEVVVVDDGSTDGGKTEAVAKAYGDRIAYYRKPNGGVASALNYGIEKMSGEYFSWLSHDDMYETEKVERQVEKILTLSGGKNIVVSNARVLYESGIKKRALIHKNTFEFFDIFLGAEADVGINGCALLIPVNVLRESGGFNPKLPVTQDYDLWYRLYIDHGCTFILLEEDLVFYRIHEGQDSIQKQLLCLEAGDDLREYILKNISYERFEAYLSKHSANLKHALANYTLYHERGYRKTTRLLLTNILRFYFDHNRPVFYEMYLREVKSSALQASHPRKSLLRGKVRLTQQQRDMLEVEFSTAIKADGIQLNSLPSLPGQALPRRGVYGAFWRVGESVRRDGIYLTGEKLVRKTHTVIARRKR